VTSGEGSGGDLGTWRRAAAVSPSRREERERERERRGERLVAVGGCLWCEGEEEENVVSFTPHDSRI